MKKLFWVFVILVLVASCNNGMDKIDWLGNKIKELRE
ncbi:hypothetical protein LCGC14_1119770 [marine sediment metagenome]|uniref:Uncharacterized protein n=1 Tax=marine sediment metagenome TaxID=412755 RepID=A0A0F9PMG3_9ZZZZ